MDSSGRPAEEGASGSGSGAVANSGVAAVGSPGVQPLPERIGLFGGTFDPPHLGHIAAAVAARDALSLDRVLLVVANCPWQKVPERTVTRAADRLAMVEAAVEDVHLLEANRSEIDRGGPSYTIDTVEALLADARRQDRDDPQIYLLVGSDVVAGLSTWERVDTLRRKVTLAVIARPGVPIGEPPAGWRVVTVRGDDVDVSSSLVKARLEHGESVVGMVPPPVIRCIALRQLYAGGQ
ncbi:MAG: nicotinate (nicotinamide) nucleotide adenylyltransferase [Acidimicrobiales bacterium]